MLNEEDLKEEQSEEQMQMGGMSRLDTDSTTGANLTTRQCEKSVQRPLEIGLPSKGQDKELPDAQCQAFGKCVIGEIQKRP